jgi:hypothetical protein
MLTSSQQHTERITGVPPTRGSMRKQEEHVGHYPRSCGPSPAAFLANVCTVDVSRGAATAAAAPQTRFRFRRISGSYLATHPFRPHSSHDPLRLIHQHTYRVPRAILVEVLNIM